MTYAFIALLIIVAIVVGLRLSQGKQGRSDPGATPPANRQDAAPISQSEPQYVPQPSSPEQARARAITEEYHRTAPPMVGWDPLDEEHAVRPEVDAGALATARANVSQDIPDDVLEEMLFQATPQQTAQLFAGVSSDVMADLTAQQSQGVHFEGQARDEDLAALSSLGSAVDDLDIWDFADDTNDSKIKA